jgi:linoleoyl-CoA desaturase
MHTIKFTSTNRSDKQFVSALRKNVNDYFKENNISTKANFAMVLKTIVLISMYVVPYILILTIPMSTLIAFLLVVLMGIGVAGVGMGVMHDACHGAYSKKHWVNNLLAGSLYLLGSNVLNWKIQHNVLHHTYTNISGLDEDINEKGPIRLAERSPLKKYHRFQFIYAFIFYGLMTLTMLLNDFMRLITYNKAGLVKSQNKKMTAEFIKMFFRKLIYLVVILGLPMLVTDFKWYQIIVGFCYYALGSKYYIKFYFSDGACC